MLFEPFAQGVVSPADPSLAPEVLKAQMVDANAKLIICCGATLKKVRRARDLAAKDIPILVMDEVDDKNLNTEGEKTLYTLLTVTLPDLCRVINTYL